MFAIAVNALYTSLRRRGTIRQLAGAIVTCAISALLLLPALVWFNMRFAVVQAALSTAEVEVALAYVALCGWLLPLGVTTIYCLFSQPRISTTPVHIPRQNRTTRANTASGFHPPRRQPGVVLPYVFREHTPWGWLEFRGGRFQGQRLALERTIITIGRGEDNDIWLDDDLASRYHAELAWDNGDVYITDCDSLNGVLLNGQRIHGSTRIEAGALLEIGSQRFLFEKATQPGTSAEQEDPLARHVWHSTAELYMESDHLPMTQPLEDSASPETNNHGEQSPTVAAAADNPVELQNTAEINPISPLSRSTDLNGVLVICDGEMAGQSFMLDRPVVTIGRGSECDVAINDASISRRHAQVLRQANGHYVQDLASRNGSKVNNDPLLAPKLLQHGDIVCLGSVRLEYIPSLQEDAGIPISSPTTPPPPARSINSKLAPLRLPSRPKHE
jgi:pSer/pThr/pTyr-binding forkhead associated (FHA) protein